MNKLVLVVLVVLALFVVGCSNQSDEPLQDTQIETEQTEIQGGQNTETVAIDGQEIVDSELIDETDDVEIGEII